MNVVSAHSPGDERTPAHQPCAPAETAFSIDQEILGASILIVDDRKLMRDMIGAILTKRGFRNLSFAVDGDSLPNCLEVTHVSLFDQTVQGVRRTDRPAFGFQGHPEASPGPQDCAYLFDEFIALMDCHRRIQTGEDA